MADMLGKIRNCRRCVTAGFDAVRPPPVFSGDLDTSLLIIGQAPGLTEHEQQSPFVGSSGKRLFSWLRQAGLEESWIREHALIFQRYLCYPGKRPDGDGDRRPGSEQLELCSPHLSSVLSLMDGLNLKLIIPVGRLAIDAFYDSSKTLEEIIGTQMGYASAQVIPLPHPSGISRWHQKQEHRALIYQALELIRPVGLTCDG
ncbi:MAG: uracil-DNA glycosylase family protein [Anaerolineales bacterium]